jgi:hypothetical protein
VNLSKLGYGASLAALIVLALWGWGQHKSALNLEQKLRDKELELVQGAAKVAEAENRALSAEKLAQKLKANKTLEEQPEAEALNKGDKATFGGINVSRHWVAKATACIDTQPDLQKSLADCVVDKGKALDEASSQKTKKKLWKRLFVVGTVIGFGAGVYTGYRAMSN